MQGRSRLRSRGRLLKLAAVLFVSILCIWRNPFRRSTHDIANNDDSRTFRVLVTSSSHYLDDVWASFLTALSQESSVEVSAAVHIKQHQASKAMLALVQNLPWFNELDIVEARRATSPEQITANKIDFIISTTCTQDLQDQAGHFDSLYNRTTIFLYCVSRDARPLQLHDPRFKHLLPWMKSNRLRIISFSEQVLQTMRNDWKHFAPIIPTGLFSPVFRIPSKTLQRKDDEIVTRVAGVISIMAYEQDLGIEGLGLVNIAKHQDFLKNYTTALAEANSKRWRPAKAALVSALTEYRPLEADKNVYDIRSLAREPVSVHRELAKASIMVVSIPALEEIEAHEQQASTAIYTAITAGTPIVFDDKMIESYPHLGKDAIIPTKPGETSMQAAFRQLSFPPLSQTRKRHSVASIRTTLLIQNKYKLRKWFRQDVQSAR